MVAKPSSSLGLATLQNLMKLWVALLVRGQKLKEKKRLSEFHIFPTYFGSRKHIFAPSSLLLPTKWWSAN